MDFPETNNSAETTPAADKALPPTINYPQLRSFEVLRASDVLDESTLPTSEGNGTQIHPTPGEKCNNNGLDELGEQPPPQNMETENGVVDDFDDRIINLTTTAINRETPRQEKGVLKKPTNPIRNAHSLAAQTFRQTCISFTTAPRTYKTATKDSGQHACLPNPPAPKATMDLKGKLMGHIVGVPPKQSSKRSIIV